MKLTESYGMTVNGITTNIDYAILDLLTEEVIQDYGNQVSAEFAMAENWAEAQGAEDFFAFGHG